MFGKKFFLQGKPGGEGTLLKLGGRKKDGRPGTQGNGLTFIKTPGKLAHKKRKREKRGRS